MVAESCRLKSEPGEDGSVVVSASFTMRPDPNMDTIIGQTAHNLDEVSRHQPIPYTLLRIDGCSKNSGWSFQEVRLARYELQMVFREVQVVLSRTAG